MQKSILHLDGDSFFVSCETSLDPSLRDLPVVTGQERGIATAMSKEAKTLGIHRGMPVFRIKKDYPQVIILPGNYDLYATFAQRMYDIVRRYTDRVEEYSIDECFADLTGLESLHKLPVEEIARRIKKDLHAELSMTFSLGLGPTKVLAKVASKTQKPDGFTILNSDSIHEFLTNLSVGSIWGIGPQTARYLRTHGVRTALEYIEKNKEWIEAHMAKPHRAIWHELRGTPVFNIHSDNDEANKSISRTRTFNPATLDKEFLFSQLSKNAEEACAKMRRMRLASRHVFCFLKTQEFRYHRFEIPFTTAISTPQELLREIRNGFSKIYKRSIPYRSTGVTLSELIPENQVQKDLFGYQHASDKWNNVYRAVDDLEDKFGQKQIFLGSSKKALEHQRSKEPKNRRNYFLHGIRIPYLGEVE